MSHSLLSSTHCLLALTLGQQDSVNVGQDTSSRNGDSSKKLVEFLVVLDGKSNVTGDDTALLVIPGSVASELENLGTEVLKNGGKVDRGTSTLSNGERRRSK